MTGESKTGELEQYKAWMQDLANIGSRNETARGFYLSVLSALIAFLAAASKDGPLHGIGPGLVLVVGFCGIAISVLWLMHTLSFTALFGAKIGRLREMEKLLP